MAICDETLDMADQALERATEQEATETRLKYSSGSDKLVNIAQAIHAETEDMTELGLTKMDEEALSNKGCVRNTAQMLMCSSYPGVTVRVYSALEEANEAANQSY